ncbi:MAG: hypothetical protein A2168_07560 [Planctomycetes bacterium RBG_13_50_24]|nr:MAG: hypothetical protein A2168_07560 [Planctomycetes bacterium RBG_13_50_24]
MIVHTYIIEIMLLILVILDSSLYVSKLGVLINQLVIQESLQKKPHFKNKIRPPPLFYWRFQ